MDTEVTFGAWLKQRRRMLDLTQTELARRVGCAVVTIRKLEDDERRPSKALAERLAGCLNLASEEYDRFIVFARARLQQTLPLDLVRAGTSPLPFRNLPPQPTPFIGRERELAEVAQFLGNPACRLLTLAGPGGIGKTRLALQAAAEALGLFADGVCFVPLVTVSSAGHLVFAIADSLKLAFYGGTEPRHQLLSYLGRKHLLLVLDSFEHLLDGGDLLVDILANAPQVNILVTSRERLHLQWEWIIDVQGLDFPDGAGTDGLTSYSAVRLFIQTAGRVEAHFSLAEQNRSYVSHICRLVEGMPLGIELAAAWVRASTCQRIALELERGLKILSTSLQDVPARHRSVKAAFDHSWQRLSAGEREVFKKLSVFRGGFRLAAAEQVAGATLPLLSALVDKSFLRRNPAGRYDLHELLRQYGVEKLQETPAESQAVQECHCAYYTEFMGQKIGYLKSGRQKAALVEMGEELENARGAWDWAIAQGRVAALGRCAEGLCLFYEFQGRQQEGEAAFGRAAAWLAQGQPGSRLHRQVLGQVLACQALMLTELGQLAQARKLYQDSVALLRPLDLQEDLVFPLVVGGNLYLALGEFEQARLTNQEILAISEACGSLWGLGCGFVQLGAVMYGLGQGEEAKQVAQKARLLCREINDYRGLSAAVLCSGWIALALGEYQEAQAFFQEGLAYAKEMGDAFMMLANLIYLGYTECARGAYPAAWPYFRQVLSTALEIGLAPLALEALVGVATLRASVRQPAQALELLALPLCHPASRQETRARAGHLLAGLGGQLPPQVMAAVQKKGPDRKLEDVTAEILGEPAPWI